MKSGVLVKYKDLLPITPETPLFSLGEGDTPLVRCEALEKEIVKRKQHLHVLQQSRAEFLCPYRIGQVVQDTRGHRAVVTGIYALLFGDGYELEGRYLLKSGKKSDKTRTLHWFDDWHAAEVLLGAEGPTAEKEKQFPIGRPYRLGPPGDFDHISAIQLVQIQIPAVRITYIFGVRRESQALRPIRHRQVHFLDRVSFDRHNAVSILVFWGLDTGDQNESSVS